MGSQARRAQDSAGLVLTPVSGLPCDRLSLGLCTSAPLAPAGAPWFLYCLCDSDKPPNYSGVLLTRAPWRVCAVRRGCQPSLLAPWAGISPEGKVTASPRSVSGPLLGQVTAEHRAKNLHVPPPSQLEHQRPLGTSAQAWWPPEGGQGRGDPGPGALRPDVSAQAAVRRTGAGLEVGG